MNHADMLAIVRHGVPDFAIHGEDITDTAWQIGRQGVLQDQSTFCDWLACEEADRTQSAYFGPVGTWELFHQVLWNDGATDDQRRAALQEVKRRYLDDKSHLVERLAVRAMQP